MPGTPHLASGEAMEMIINGVYSSHDFSYWTSSRLRQHKFSHVVYVDRKLARNEHVTGQCEELDPNEFECLELNFKSALVLPNLYKSDKFIAKALKNDGKVLVMEPATSGANYQKAIAIILGYLMYYFELRFWDACDVLRKSYRPKFELDRFLVIQLYEYEPILEVRRAAEEMGHSRSGERLRSVLKRTSCALDTSYEETATLDYYHPHHNHHQHSPQATTGVLLAGAEQEVNHSRPVSTSGVEEDAENENVLELLQNSATSNRRRSLEPIETMVE